MGITGSTSCTFVLVDFLVTEVGCFSSLNAVLEKNNERKTRSNLIYIIYPVLLFFALSCETNRIQERFEYRTFGAIPVLSTLKGGHWLVNPFFPFKDQI